MTKVYSRFDVPKTIKIGPFPKEINTYTEEIDEKGRKTIKAIGKHNFYKQIQAYKDDTMVYNILERFKNGDITALNKKSGAIYGDFTKAPKTIQEAHAKISQSHQIFEKMPLEVKREFNHNPNEFLAAAQKGTLQNRIAKAQGIDLEKQIKMPNITKPETINPGTTPGQQALNQVLNKTINQGTIPGQTEIQQQGGIKYE